MTRCLPRGAANKKERPMNKTEKIWVAVLVAALLGYIFLQMRQPEQPQPSPLPPPSTHESSAVQSTPEAVAKPAEATANAEQATPQANGKAAEITAAEEQPKTDATPAEPKHPTEPLAYETLSNDKVTLSFANYGVKLTKAELKDYPEKNEEGSGPVVMEMGHLLDLTIPGETNPLIYTLKKHDDRTLEASTTLKNGVIVKRTITLDDAYTVTVKDAFTSATGAELSAYTFNAGRCMLPDQGNEVLGADLMAAGESEAEHFEGNLGDLLGAPSAFLGCGTTSDPTGVALSKTTNFNDQAWVALKNRFFVTLAQPQSPTTINLTVARANRQDKLHINEVSATFDQPAITLQPGQTHEMTTRLYVGPKEYSRLADFGADAKDVMDFGWWAWFRWICALLLWVLNAFYALIPNYGVAIILLTLVVRLIFWPLTRKSTLAMRKMTAIQPQMKEIQAKFKDNPQKMQQETFKLYRDNKVNPFSSCLPLLIQIPIFIALFIVLRSAVELRFAGFLWISDLTQPENLFAGVLPLPLNILPILTAVTMGLQTHLSPSTGDPAQKRMMTWMMPIMMLFFFYSMPSALCLYWTVSQALSIVQMWHIQRTTAKEQAAALAK